MGERNTDQLDEGGSSPPSRAGPRTQRTAAPPGSLPRAGRASSRPGASGGSRRIRGLPRSWQVGHTVKRRNEVGPPVPMRQEDHRQIRAGGRRRHLEFQIDRSAGYRQHYGAEGRDRRRRIDGDACSFAERPRGCERLLDNCSVWKSDMLGGADAAHPPKSPSWHPPDAMTIIIVRGNPAFPSGLRRTRPGGGDGEHWRRPAGHLV